MQSIVVGNKMIYGYPSRERVNESDQQELDSMCKPGNMALARAAQICKHAGLHQRRRGTRRSIGEPLNGARQTYAVRQRNAARQTLSACDTDPRFQPLGV